MKIGSYQFTTRFITSAILPEYKGSTLRGAFGRALKQCACALRRQECPSCMLAASCCHSFIFEGQTVNGSQGKQHPYVIETDDDPRREYSPGDTLSFSFLLFGRANDYLPHVVYAIQEMGKTGLGKNTPEMGCYSLEQVARDGRILFQNSTLHQADDPPQYTLSPADDRQPQAITLICHTPLRLKYHNQLQDGLPFHIVIRAALRRISSLEAAYGNGEPDLDYRGLVAQAASVRQTVADCHWTDIQRYSSRQKTTMQLGGITGRMVYQGDNLAAFLPLLRYCEKTHLGKQTTFGLGRIRVEVPA
ncbi:MAG: CRISPR system precrRNA processing endoribonuclease RAMP protein Cas6 [Pseudomonadota bacterium]